MCASASSFFFLHRIAFIQAQANVRVPPIPCVQVPEEKDGFLLVPGATLPAGPWSQLPQDEFVAKQNAELNNGRLAMISIFLIVMQEVVSKLPAAEFDAQTLDFLGGLLNTPGMFFE